MPPPSSSPFSMRPGATLVPPLRSIQCGPASGQLVEEEINGGNQAVPGDDEIRSGVCWRIARATGYPWDVLIAYDCESVHGTRPPGASQTGRKAHRSPR